ncbi:MAG: hypothetical protein HYR90_03695 [Candidatus Andersenbacteria bacterium]|nr:hypothetical protein [Candidatus Andersenbacteria bacterium]MBI3250368.1 hypothetical protein [Candidatus Andersenbacteria bacterium]
MENSTKQSYVWQEVEFIEAFTNPLSSTFANGRRSALQVGYSPWYARNIRSHFPPHRIMKLQRIVEARRAVTGDEQENKIIFEYVDKPLTRRIVRKNRRALPSHLQPTPFEQVSRELDELLGPIE